MNNTINSADEIDGSLECPGCGEVLGESDIQEERDLGSTHFSGNAGDLWVHVEVVCGKCNTVFEVGGHVGVTEVDV